MNLTYTIAIISSSGFAAIITWLLTRKKSKAETTKIELQNVESVVQLWKKIAEDLGAEVTQLTTEVNNLRKENSQLRTEMLRLESLIQKKIP